MGDPAGVGAEVTVKALADPAIAALASWRIAGNENVLTVAQRITGLKLPAGVEITDPAGDTLTDVTPGTLSAACGGASVAYIKHATELCLRDLLASRNSEPTLAFVHGGVDGSRSFRVVLKGPRGNPDAIGAVLTLELADGSTQRTELHAGSGYQTQNPRGAFFAYPAASPPRRITVRWPDGRTTEREMREPPSAVLEIE
jgi:hypothetical protein